MITLSLVICTKDRPTQLRRCLESVLGQTCPPDEIVIVDASIDDKSLSVVKEMRRKKRSPRFLYTHTYPGTARQRNIGFEMANAYVVGSVDDDTILDKEALRIIKEVFNKGNTDLGGVMPRLIDPKDRRQSIWSLKSLYKRIFMLSHNFAKHVFIQASGFPAFPFQRQEITEPQEAEVLNGLYFYKKEVVKNYKFNEGFHGYSFMEDVEFAYRVSKNFKLLYVPSARIMHLHVPTSRSSYFETYKQIVENHHYFFLHAIEGTFVNWLAFYWSHIGLLISALSKKNALGRGGSLSGVLSGFRAILRLQRIKRYQQSVRLSTKSYKNEKFNAKAALSD
ncbi:glycosyltransferase family 2 protein [bacterium]|nr:glycosyltransferase family 2 protein [bacterium]